MKNHRYNSNAHLSYFNVIVDLVYLSRVMEYRLDEHYDTDSESDGDACRKQCSRDRARTASAHATLHTLVYDLQ